MSPFPKGNDDNWHDLGICALRFRRLCQHAMVSLDPLSRPGLDLMSAIQVLHRHQVKWVMTGSLVLVAHGARLIPGDLDITPALDPDNLEATAAVLSEVDAIPLHDPDWPKCPPLDWHYGWSPRPASVENLDHLMVTTVGRLDVVPRLCGTFEELAPNAVSLGVGGLEVLVADPTSVLDRLGGRPRNKDVDRRSEIERVRTAIESGTLELVGLGHLT